MNRTELTARVIEHAKSYTGTISRASKVNGFGQTTGMNGSSWDGSFLETVFRETGTDAGTSLTSTAGALAYYHRVNRVYSKPRPGDIVFFAWSTDTVDGLGQPHVGLVSEVDKTAWKRYGKFRTVEGQIDSGTPRGRQEQDGVYSRTRYATDVIGFARPAYTETVTVPLPGELPAFTVGQFKSGKGLIAAQRSLHVLVGASGMEPGKLDGATVSAVRRFQAERGILPVTGQLTPVTIIALTGAGLFRVKI